MTEPRLTRLRRQFRSAAEVRLFVRMLALATVLPLLLRRLSVPRLLQLLTPRARVGTPAGTERVERLVGYSNIILYRRFWVYRPNCLKRSLLLYYFLRQAGYEVQLYLGVQPTALDGEKGGHAWLMYRGEPFQEPQSERLADYVVTYRYPDDSSQGQVNAPAPAAFS